MTQPTTPSRARAGASGTILTAGAVVGVVDGLFAMVVQYIYLGRSEPLRIFQGIASGLMGADAFAAGAASAALGLALHFGFATFWSVLFVLGARRLTFLARPVREHAVLAGAAFGFLVWLAMNYVAKPIGGMTPTAALQIFFLIMTLGHGVVVGLPTVLLIRAGGVDRSA